MDIPFIEIKIEQDTDQWHEYRSHKIGASEASYVLDINPWKTRLQHWNERLLGERTKSNSSMEHGKRTEPKARKWAIDNLREDFRPAVLESTIHSQISASLDGFSGDNAIEIKCPSSEASFLKLSEEVPDYYYAQMQHQLFVTGFSSMYFLAYFEGKGQGHLVYRDEKFIQNLVSQELAFFSSLINFEPPEPTDRDWVEIFDSMASVKAERYKDLSSEISESQKELDFLKKELISYATNPHSILSGLKMQKIFRKGNVDYATIPELQSVDLNQYRKPASEYWKITC